MLIELPIALVNSHESSIIGEDNATTKFDSMTIRTDCIHSIHPNGDSETSILSMKNGNRVEILMPYKDLRKVWIKAIELQSGVYFASYLNPDEGTERVDKKSPAVDKFDIDKLISGEN